MIDYILKFLLVFSAMALTDVCWAYYFIKVNERQSIQASFWAVALFFSGAIVTTNYVDDNSLIIAAALGSFAGTYFTIEYKKRKDDTQDYDPSQDSY